MMNRSATLKIQVIWATLLACLLMASTAQAATQRILVVGDSWSYYAAIPEWGDLEAILDEQGYGEYTIDYTQTAQSGSKASDWVGGNKTYTLETITERLDAYPTIDIVLLIIGGNDFLNQTNDTDISLWTPAQREAMYAEIIDDIETMLTHILNVRSDIKVVLCGYSHLDVAKMGSAYGFTFGGMSQQDFNTYFAELGALKRDLCLQYPRSVYVQNFGYLQWFYGDTPTYAAQTVPFPGPHPFYDVFPGGDLTQRGAPAGLNTDGVHLSVAGQEQVNRRLIQEIIGRWLEPDSLHLSTVDYGASAAGTFDDTDAIQATLDAAAAQGGGVAVLPRGRYRVDGQLTVPAQVTLEGVNRTPDVVSASTTGSYLEVYGGQGDTETTPTLTLNDNATVKGISIGYPNQTGGVSFPWAIRGNGSDVGVVDVSLVNPWLGIDLGSTACDRFLVRRVHGQPLKTGLFVDQSEGGRIEDLKFAPLWDDTISPGQTAFRVGGVDRLTGLDIRCEGFTTGFEFVRTRGGAAEAMLTNVTAIADSPLVVEAVDIKSGIQFATSRFEGLVSVAATNFGPVKFHNCSFSIPDDYVVPPSPQTLAMLDLAGEGSVLLQNCNLSGWEHVGAGRGAIGAENRALIVTGSLFQTTDALLQKVTLGSGVREAVVTANMMVNGVAIDNQTDPGASIEINLNANITP